MKTLFVAPVSANVGLTSAALGLVRALQRAAFKVGFCKPIAQDHGPTDHSTHFAREIGHLEAPAPIPLERTEALLSQQETDTLMEEVVGLYQRAAAGQDVVVVEGIALTSRNPYASALNPQMARTLGAGVVLVASLADGDTAELAEGLEIAARDFAERLVGFVVNFVPEGVDSSRLLAQLHAPGSPLAKVPALALVPRNPELSLPRTLDVARHLGAEILNEGQIKERRVRVNMVTARSVPHIVDLFKPGTLVVAPGDREDVIMATSLASLNGVPLAGLLLTSGSQPQEAIYRLCKPALSAELPLMIVESNSFETVRRLEGMDKQVPLDDLGRMEKVLDFVADRLDTAPLQSQIHAPSERRLSPPAFRYELIQRARAANKRIVLPEGDEPRTVKAAAICHEKGIAHCILLAKPESVRSVAEAQGVILPESIQIVDPDSIRERYVEPMVELRKHKGLTAPQALQQLEDNVVLGTMMLALDEVDGLVSGAIHTTANTVRPALQLIKTAPGVKLVSSVFFMLMPEQVLVYGDCAINPDPTPEELADIALQSADSAAAFGIEPRVAMISYSTGSSGEGADVEKVALATQIAKARRPDLLIDGPLQYDAASVKSVGQQKAPGSPVAGRATVFIFPDLNTGNTTYKAVQRSAGVVSVGPMLQGLRKPVNDLSRGALVDDIVYTIALTAIQATQTPRVPAPLAGASPNEG
ncbi:MAG TPA: phosphate acetyltransferase [Meiothermus sp.]|nr:phosphate acetyltransferase [Meiothermus sp.]